MNSSRRKQLNLGTYKAYTQRALLEDMHRTCVANAKERGQSVGLSCMQVGRREGEEGGGKGRRRGGSELRH